jgi:hypothetical protein
MPAYRERVTICPAQSGQPAWVEEFPLWWDRTEFFEKYGDRRFDTGHPVYVDYGLLLAGWEARSWDQHCRDQFIQNPHSTEAFWVEVMQRWESLLAEASWVIVESYEWESGLD